MKVEVDLGLCQGHGVCESESPDVFYVSKENVVEVLNTNPPEDLRASVVEAVKNCPTQAITLTESED